MTESLITQHIDLWTSAIEAKSTAGRGSKNKFDLYGIKKLRELILELAVRGKLVPQDPTDEPASVLLERIAEEKTKLIKEKIVKKSAGLPEIPDDELPFELPAGWAFSRLGNITSRLGSGSTPRGGANVYVEEGVPFLRSQNIWNEGIRLDDIAYIPHSIHQNMENTQVQSGDILLNITGASLGRTTIFPEYLKEANVSQHVTVIRLINKQMNHFVHLCMSSPLVQKLVWKRQVGVAIEGLSKKVLELFEFPIPPLKEQHRIVAKVDELMALCDQLEQQTLTSIDAHATLVETLLETLTNSADAAELEQNWARISEHFDTLFITEQSIDALKQTILQLAVMGKLVRQDPTDEPASVLLEKIAAEKAQLIKDKKIKKEKPLPPISDDEKPFELPQGWEWCRLNSIVHILGDGLHGTPEYSENGDFFFINGNNLINGLITIKPETKKVDRIQYEKYKKNLNERSVLVSINGTLGNIAFYNDEPIILGKSACYFNLSENVYKNFIKLLVESPIFTMFANLNATGSTIKNLGLNAMNNFPIALPPRSEQKAIICKVHTLIDLCERLKSEMQQQRQLKLILANEFVAKVI